MKIEDVSVERPRLATVLPLNPDAAPDEVELVIEPRSGWQSVDLRELLAYRDLVWFNAWRAIRGRYVQSALGLGWAVVQPLISMLIFTLIFGYMALIPRSDEVPYPLFVFCGIVPWAFFSGALSNASQSLISNAGMLSKVYFPRLILPLSEVLARCFDLAINLVMLGMMLAYYGYAPRAEALVMIPAMTLLMMLAALGAGLWLSAMAVQYRDVAYGLNFLIQIGFYVTPVIYDVTRIPDRLLLIFGLNPMVGVIATYRAALLGMPPIPGVLVAESVAVTAVLLVTGTFYFRRTERIFADVV